MTGELEGEEFWQAALGEAGKRLLQWILEELGKALLRLLKAAIVVYLNTRLAEFTTATRDRACGVTLVFTFNHPGLRALNVGDRVAYPGSSRSTPLVLATSASTPRAMIGGMVSVPKRLSPQLSTTSSTCQPL